MVTGAIPYHTVQYIYCIQYVLLTQERKLKLKLSRSDKVKVRAICNTDYARDPETRQSISRFIVHVNDCPMTWPPRQLKIMSLSSCEIKYYAMTKAASKLLYV